MIGVVIPYYKDTKALNKCLNCLIKQNISYEVYIRDNSVDNILFTKAINEGIRNFRDKKYILMLNQDCYLEDNCLNNMIDFMESNNKCGISCPVTYTESREITFAGAKSSFPNGEHINEIVSNNPYKTHWINGACMMLRTDMLNEIGILDENMKFICSDSDISFTARSRGWDLYVISNASATHSLNGCVSSEDYIVNIKKEDIKYFKKKWYSSDLFKELDFSFNKNL